jgi:hypothetical protein
VECLIEADAMLLQNRALGLALEREKQKAAGVSAELQKTKLIGTVPQAGSTDPQVCNAPCYRFNVILSTLQVLQNAAP